MRNKLLSNLGDRLAIGSDHDSDLFEETRLSLPGMDDLALDVVLLLVPLLVDENFF